MTVPDWKTDTDEKRRAFTRFVIDRLEEDDERRVERFARMFLERSADPSVWSMAREQFEAERLARKHGGTVAWAEDRKAAHRPKGSGLYARAKRDLPRIRAIFKRYWPNNEKRTFAPSAEQIAAERWNLPSDEATKLHKAVQRP